MLKIDAHNHPYFHGRNCEDMIRNMDENGISKTWLLSWETPHEDYSDSYIAALPSPMDDTCAIAFRYCWDYYEKAPDRFILGYAPDPTRPGAIQKMRAAINMYRVQICGEMKYRIMYDNFDAIALYRFCGEHGLPVTFHFDYPDAQKTGRPFPRTDYWYGGDIDTLERILIKCPETNFLGHAPGFWCHISDDDLGLTNAYPNAPVKRGGKIEKFLEKYPNLYCDCSAGSCLNALKRDIAYTKELLLTYPDRFVFARDYYDSDLDTFLGELGLPEDVAEMIYHGNAERLAAPVQKV